MSAPANPVPQQGGGAPPTVPIPSLIDIRGRCGICRQPMYLAEGGIWLHVSPWAAFGNIIHTAEV